MMVPNFETIMGVKLCSQGYNNYLVLATKFFQLYDTCKQQLSKQRHYDWGLRNILAVLRTAGATKRKFINPDFSLPRGKHEDILLFQTLRDMNLSKMVAQDVPLFLSLLQDLFPKEEPPAKAVYEDIFAELPITIEKFKKVYYDDWVNKIVQLFETTIVRHGIMLCGPSGGGKSVIADVLMETLINVNKLQYKMPRMNPKAMKPSDMYGLTDPASQEWVTGVFAAIWARANTKTNTFWTWMMMDGPVDAIWIEDLNTVLDDNKILTLANGDRMPMTDMCKIMFEVETLKNASPATVSRAGIIYVSDTDLDWSPVAEGIIRLRPENQREVLRAVVKKYKGESSPIFPGTMFDFINRNCRPVQDADRVGLVYGAFDLLSGLLDVHEEMPPPVKLPKDDPARLAVVIERTFLYCIAWGVGGLLDSEDRAKLDAWLRGVDNTCMPACGEGETLFEYFLNEDGDWSIWRPPKWVYPNTDKLDFANLLVPTMDSTRAIFLIETIHKQRRAPLMVGEPGTAKTSTALMFFDTLPIETMLRKQVNFSSATQPRAYMDAIEADLEKRGGKNFGPPLGKRMTVFIDDISMPEINKWGDQITNEMVRILLEQSGFPFLDKDRRGDWKVVDDLQYMAGMGKPGGGKNDIPNRLKRQFFKFNMVLPSIVSINDIYGQMLNGRFPKSEFDQELMAVVQKLTKSTIKLWDLLKAKMLPTPAKFHYIFNMRDLSRVFQGILLTPKSTIHMGGGILTSKDGDARIDKQPGDRILLKLWQHECNRVFGDKLTNNPDKDLYGRWLKEVTIEDFGEEVQEDCEANPAYMVSCLRDDVFDEDEVLVEKAPKIYELGGSLPQIRATALDFMEKHNVDNPQTPMTLVLFDDALKHLFRINRLLEMPRGSALLVGVGGSGKQSLTRLAAYISRSRCFQIVLTKTYNMAALDEDIRGLYRTAGRAQSTTFLFTDSEIKDEMFLEKINTVLMTGNVPGLFAKDEVLATCGDVQPAFAKNRPNLPENNANIFNYFLEVARDNLHVVLCFSPMNKMYPIRAQKFPGLFSCPSINFFLPWPQDALVNVSEGFIRPFNISCSKAEKENVIVHMGVAHSLVVDVCDEYFSKMRRAVFQTPKSYLSFLNSYKKLYKSKLDVLMEKEAALRLGLEKLIQGAEDVAAMKLVLKDEQVKLDKATKETNDMLEGLQVSSAAAQKEGEAVAVIKAACEADAARIAIEKANCEADLAQAQPFVDQANEAIASVQKKDIQDISANKNPVAIICLIFDVVLILFQFPVLPAVPEQLNFSSGKIVIDFFAPSFKTPKGENFGQKLVGGAMGDFLKMLQGFGAEGGGKDFMTEETVELISPYLDLEVFNADIARAASGAAAGLCTFAGAMKSYYYAAKIVRPKLEALSIALASLDEANNNLKAAEEKLAGVQAKVADLQKMFENQMAEKKKIEDGAAALAKKAQQASDLINGLGGEQKRWGEDADRSKRPLPSSFFFPHPPLPHYTFCSDSLPSPCASVVDHAPSWFPQWWTRSTSSRATAPSRPRL